MTTAARPPAVRRLPSGPGVYRFRDARDRVLYIGRATALRQRVGSYWSDLRDRRHLVRMVAQVARIEAVACDSVHEAAWLERNLLRASLPRWNRTPGGQESQVYIRLSRRPAGTPLAVVYRPQPGLPFQYFGPYLGGVRARQAVAALYRLRPAADASAVARGLHLDLARARGRHPATAAADQDLEALAAVLHKDPAAVAQARAELVAALSHWDQRACEPAEAAPHLAATPPAWTEFATRNAELAATLATDPVPLAG